MSGWTALLCIGAALCRSLRGALLLTALTAVTLFAVQGVRALTARRLPLPAWGGGVLAVGVGGALWLMIQAFFPAFAGEVTTPWWAFLLFFCCGIAALPAAGGICRTAAAWWVIGAVRELLAEGRLFGWQITAQGVSSAFGDGMGGLLVAAGVLWAFRMGSPHPLVPPPCRKEILLTAGITAILCAAQPFLSPLSQVWRFWAAAVLTVAGFAAAGQSDDDFAVLIPLAAVGMLPPAEFPQTVVWAAVAALAAGGVTVAARAIFGRVRRTPAAFGGAPIVLLVAAFLTAAVAPL